jgi:hypothetical protein
MKMYRAMEVQNSADSRGRNGAIDAAGYSLPEGAGAELAGAAPALMSGRGKTTRPGCTDRFGKGAIG